MDINVIDDMVNISIKMLFWTFRKKYQIRLQTLTPLLSILLKIVIVFGVM